MALPPVGLRTISHSLFFRAANATSLKGWLFLTNCARGMPAAAAMANANRSVQTFAGCIDSSGEVVRVERDRLPEGVYPAFKKWDVGDIVGATGVLMRTNKGELSVQADKIVLLNKTLRPLPEKYHGLEDREIRYRQRYLDLIANERSRETFLQRCRMVAEIRRYLG